MSALCKQLEAMKLPLPGLHPSTAEKFVACTVERTREHTSVDFLEPTRPTRIETTWDADDNAIDRELSDEEYEAAIARYEKAWAKWNETRGHAQILGPSTTTATFTTESGSTATAMLTEDEKEWFWRSWAVRT